MNSRNIKRIHNINEKFNRLFSHPLYVGAFLILCILFVLPYYGRLFVALLINVFFNRFIIYLNYISRLIIKPIHFIQVGVFYYILFGSIAMVYKIFNFFSGSKRAQNQWRPAVKHPEDTLRYQS
jgi:hypothetical protein